MIIRPTIMDRNYDSVLHPARGDKPAELMLRLRVALVPFDPSGAPTNGDYAKIKGVVSRNPAGIRHGRVSDTDGRPFRCRTWLEPEFNAFAIKFKQMVELSWNNQLILLPPDGTGYVGAMSDSTYRDFIGRRDIPAHVICSIDVQVLDIFNLAHLRGRRPHAVMDVVRLDPPADGEFRSNQLMITSEDLEFRRTRSGLRQVTAAHEVGHWLGSPVPAHDMRRYKLHVGAHEDGTGERNSPEEYGRTQGERMALLGLGQLLTYHEAIPWLDRVMRHSDCYMGWEIVHRVHFAKRTVPVSARQRRLVSARP